MDRSDPGDVHILVKHSGEFRTFSVKNDGLSDEDENDVNEQPTQATISYHFDEIDFCQTLLKMIHTDHSFRSRFMSRHAQVAVYFDLDASSPNPPLDYKSCRLVSQQLWQEIETEDALNWLSTLGGAYSNLGEHSEDFARQAGDNAKKQMQVILRSQQLHKSPSVILRCWLFLAMSAMQQGRLKDSRKILQSVYQTSKTGLTPADRDVKIEKMCLGIWSRLKYAWQVNKKSA